MLLFLLPILFPVQIRAALEVTGKLKDILILKVKPYFIDISTQNLR